MLTENTEVKNPPFQSIIQLFEQRVSKTPNAPAVALAHGDTLTFFELNRYANQLAHFLSHKTDLRKKIIAIAMASAFEVAIAILAVLKVGGTYLLLDPHYPEKRLRYMLDDSNAAALLTTHDLIHKVNYYQGPIIEYNILANIFSSQNTTNLHIKNSPEDIVYIVYTSGSTGNPKGVIMPEKPLFNYIQWHIRNNLSESPLTTLQYSPLSFDISFQELFSTWLTGNTVVLSQNIDRRDSAVMLNILLQCKINRIFLPNSALIMLAQYCNYTNIFPLALKQIINVGEPLLLTPIVKMFLQKTHFSLINLYGASEVQVVSIYTVNTHSPPIPPVGRAIANTSIYILDANLNPVAMGDVGQIYVGGEGLAQGYLNSPDLTAQKFIKNTFSSDPHSILYNMGDLGRYLPDGNIEFLGRSDNQIKLRGYRIELGEIESIICLHSSVLLAAVILNSESYVQPKLVAYITLQNNLSADKQAQITQEIKSLLKEKLPIYMIPTLFHYLNTIPITPSGKINKKLLASAEFTLPKPTFPSPVTNKIENVLINLCKKHMGLSEINLDDNLFETNDSLSTVSLCIDINFHFRINISPTTIFNYPSIRELATYIKDKKITLAIKDPFFTIQSEGTKPPIILIHPAGGLAFCYRNLVGQFDNQPIFAISNPRYGEDVPFTSIKTMAESYVNLIKNHSRLSQAKIYLGGWSFGGIVALEMAKLLDEQHVAGVILIDSFNPLEFDNEYEITPEFLKIFDIDINTSKGKIHNAELLNNRRLVMGYNPSYFNIIYNGRIILLKAFGIDEEIDLLTKSSALERDSKFNGWENIYPQIEVHPLSGSHYRLFDVANTPEIAKKMALSLAL